MNIREAIDTVTSLYSKGTPSVDSRLLNRQVWNLLRRTRSTILSQQSAKRQNLSETNYQELSAIGLKVVSIHELPCLPPGGMTMLRSTYPIPTIVHSLDKPVVASVTSLDGWTSYGYTKFHFHKYKRGNKYTSLNPDWFIKEYKGLPHLYLTVKGKTPSSIRMIACFEDPIEAYRFKNWCDDLEVPCPECEDCISNLDFNFPMDTRSFSLALSLVKEEILKEFASMKEDLTTDGKDSLVEESK